MRESRENEIDWMSLCRARVCNSICQWNRGRGERERERGKKRHSRGIVRFKSITLVRFYTHLSHCVLCVVCTNASLASEDTANVCVSVSLANVPLFALSLSLPHCVSLFFIETFLTRPGGCELRSPSPCVFVLEWTFHWSAHTRSIEVRTHRESSHFIWKSFLSPLSLSLSVFSIFLSILASFFRSVRLHENERITRKIEDWELPSERDTGTVDSERQREWESE